MPWQRDKNTEVEVPNLEEENNQGHLKQMRILSSIFFFKNASRGAPSCSPGGLRFTPSIKAARNHLELQCQDIQCPFLVSGGIKSAHGAHTHKCGPDTHTHRIGKNTPSKEQMVLMFQWDGSNCGQRDQRQ